MIKIEEGVLSELRSVLKDAETTLSACSDRLMTTLEGDEKEQYMTGMRVKEMKCIGRILKVVNQLDNTPNCLNCNKIITAGNSEQYIKMGKRFRDMELSFYEMTGKHAIIGTEAEYEGTRYDIMKQRREEV